MGRAKCMAAPALSSIPAFTSIFQRAPMRTTKRFTPAVLNRFEREGRGTGILQDYIPWHRVSRGDPASSGRSHWHLFRGRFIHLLSDLERSCLHFISMRPGVEDCLEQFPLSIEHSTHPLTSYGSGNPLKFLPGTRDIAETLGYRHPQTHGGGTSCAWVQTTDFVVVLSHECGRKSLLAVAVKPRGALSKRTRQLLAIERSYWLARGAEWLLFTPDLFAPQVKKSLEQISPWNREPLPDLMLQNAASLTRAHKHLAYLDLLQVLDAHFGSRDVSQRALWQSVWHGMLPIDLAHPWRPTRPLRHIGQSEFLELNPLATRRSSWTS